MPTDHSDRPTRRDRDFDYAKMPTDVTGRLSAFDRFADYTSKVVSRAGFFAFCLLLVILWAPSILLLKSVDS
ncbi:hypothetical protein [Amycolatopsis sp. NPDC052450]|uniref:hypothetical protein n=1 Tax=Amycolatopsis sp. NPDC052450 TaxID=3363937 RepID=UPI0037C7CE91